MLFDLMKVPLFVRLGLADFDGAATRTAITIRNDAPALAPEMLAHLRDRFVRGGTAVSGSGPGLAIVDAILEQTGGRLTITSPPAGHAHGFEAVLASSFEPKRLENADFRPAERSHC